MAAFRLMAMDEYLKDLAYKRKLLEQKCAIRKVTIAEFSALRRETISKSQERLAHGNRYAHERNVKLLEDLNSSIHLTSSRALKEDANLVKSASRLEAAKDIYSITACQMLPAWRTYRSDQQVQAAIELRKQRELIEKRHQRALQDAEEELKNMMILEEERRKYLLAVALENRDTAVIQSQASSLLAESKAVDYLLERELEKHHRQIHSRDAELLQNMKERLNVSLDNIGSSIPEDGGKSNIYSNIPLYHESMTSPEVIANALRNAPVPPPIKIDPPDLDVPRNRHHHKRVDPAEYYSEQIREHTVKPKEPIESPRNEDPPTESAGRDGQDNRNFFGSNVQDRTKSFVIDSQMNADEAMKYTSMSHDENESSFARGESIVGTGGPEKAFNRSVGGKTVQSQDKYPLHTHFTPRGLAARGSDLSPDDSRTKTRPVPTGSAINDHNRPEPIVLDRNNSSASTGNAAVTGNVSFEDTADSRIGNVSRISPLQESRNFSMSELYSNAPLVPENLSPHQKIELLNKLCHRLEALDDVSRERQQTDSRLRRDEQYLTAIQAYRKAVKVILGYNVSNLSAAIDSSALVSNAVPDYLHELCKAVLDGREKETALYGTELVAEAIIQLAVEIGPDLLPRDILNGVITEDKVHRNMKRLGEGRMELWLIMVHHLKGLVLSKGATSEELSKIFTTALVFHTPAGDERHRAERKIHTLLQLEIMPKEEEGQSTRTTVSINTSVPDARSSNLDHASAPAALAVVGSEPAKKLSSPRAVDKELAGSSMPRQDSDIRRKAIAALDSFSADTYNGDDSNNSELLGLSPMQKYGKQHHLNSPKPGISSSTVLTGRTSFLQEEQNKPTALTDTKKSGALAAPADVNSSMTSSLPMSSNFRSSSFVQNKVNATNQPIQKAKWSAKKPIISLEDDELVSDEDEIAAPPPLRVLEENSADSNEFEF